MSQKPAQYPAWTNGQAGQVARPPDSLRQSGFSAGQAPAAQIVNSLFYDLGQWVEWLDNNQGSSILAATLDSSLRLIGGGTLRYVASTQTWSWSSAFSLSVPSVADTDNQIAAGSVVIPDGSVAYALANLPFSTTADLTSGSSVAQNLAYDAAIVAGQTVTGSGIASGTTVVSTSTGADGSHSVTLSKAATATATQASLAFCGVGPLSVSVSPVATLVPSANMVVLARGMGSHVFVGVNAAVAVVHDGEARTLLEPGYTGILRVPAGLPLTALQAVYISQGFNSSMVQEQTLLPGYAYPTDCSSLYGAVRGQVAGIVATNVTPGNMATIITGGLVPGSWSWPSGAPIYLNASTPGALSTSPPAFATTPYCVRVGVATAYNTILLRPAFAPDGIFPSVQASTVSSAAGFKSRLGPYTAASVSNFSNGANYYLKDSSGQAAQIVCDCSGSIVGLALYDVTSNSTAGIVVSVGKNDASFSGYYGTKGTTGPACSNYVSGSGACYSWAKGVYTFAKGDILNIFVATPATNAFTLVSVQAYITIELAA